MHEVREDTIELDEQPVFLLRAGESGDDDAPALYVHGVPTSADDWRPFLELGGGLAVDLPGFGRSGKRGDLDFTLRGYARWLPRLLDVLGIERVRLCVHDWGAAALAWAADHPERVERLVVVNALPLMPGYRWHRIARALRAPGVGEMTVGLAVAPVLRRVVQTGISGEHAPRRWLDDIAARFDQGTQRAVLRLYRGSDEAALAAAGEHLDALGMPALVVWGLQDPWLPPDLGVAYARALPHAELMEVSDAGHWPWLERPDLVERIVAFLHG